MMKFKRFDQLLYFISLFILILFSNILKAEVQSIEESIEKFKALTSSRLERIKEGSRPFILTHHKKTKTVVMIHGLSDSPESLKEASVVYFKRGYNVVTVLLRDHGLFPEFRHEIRADIKLMDWREDIDQLMKIALEMSDGHKVALIGFSLGGALALDTANRYEGNISSLVLLAPLLKMNHGWAAPSSRLLRHVKYSIFKEVPETEHFYPDIALNQTYQAFKLTKHLKEKVTKNPSKKLIQLPKMMFLTDADTTVENDYAIEVAEKIKIENNNLIIYSNPEKISTTLHRDLPMRTINASGIENPHIEDLLYKLDKFLASLES